MNVRVFEKTDTNVSMNEVLGAVSRLYGFESWGMKVKERDKLDGAEMKCPRSMCGVTRMYRVRNEVVRERVGVPEKF